MNNKEKAIKNSIERIQSVVDEMGNKRFKQYMKAYIEVKGVNNPKLFFVEFSNYIDQCKEDKSGYKKISINSFKNYIAGLPSIDQLKQIWDNWEDSFEH